MKLGRIIIFSVFLLIGCDKESPFQMLTVSFDSQGGSATQELALTLTAAQKTTWNDEWKTLPRNAAVTVPAETAE